MQDTSLKLDALFTILEKHLYDFDDNTENESEFVDKIVNDYLRFLTESNVVIPRKYHHQITDELRNQVRNMLVKKMYGCLSIEEFIKQQPDAREKRKLARKKYSGIF